MATYSYMGLRVVAPSWVTYIAMDRNFFVYGFRSTPAYDTDADEWVFPAAADVILLGSLHQLSGSGTSILSIILF